MLFASALGKSCLPYQSPIIIFVATIIVKSNVTVLLNPFSNNASTSIPHPIISLTPISMCTASYNKRVQRDEERFVHSYEVNIWYCILCFVVSDMVMLLHWMLKKHLVYMVMMTLYYI